MLTGVKDNYIVSFTSSTCVIQDHLSKILIREGEEQNELYFSKEVAPTHITIVTSLNSKELWHQRLGHSSDSAINFLSRVSNSKNNSPGDICFNAKQTREPFANSLNKASGIFSLIHHDM